MYIVTLDLTRYKDILVSRHRSLKAARAKHAKLTRKSIRQPAMAYHVYKRVC